MPNFNLFQFLSDIPPKIKNAFQLAALAVLLLGMMFYSNSSDIIVAIVIILIFFIVIAGFIFDSKKRTPSRDDIHNPLNISKDLRVKENIWDGLDKSLVNIGFEETKRNDAENLMGGNYEFSWAKENGSGPLFIVQLDNEKLTTDVIYQVIGMGEELKKKRGVGDIKNVVICDVQNIYDGLYYRTIGDNTLALITNYAINEIKKGNSEHLKTLLFRTKI